MEINASENNYMKLISKLNVPQKSIFGFKILSSFQSSISCYVLLLGKSLNIFFGSNRIHLIAGSFFNIILNLSIIILIANLINKRKQIKKLYFIFFNFIPFTYMPFALIGIFKYSKILFFLLFRYPNLNNTDFNLT